MNPKLIDLAPTWAPYRGWSVLFAPRPAETGHRERALLDAEAHRAPTSETYDRLHEWFADVSARLGGPAGLATLPRSTYHVTVCDGPNQTMFEHLDDHARSLLAPTRDALADAWAPLTDLLAAASQPIDLRVTGVAARGTAVLAELTPTRPVDTLVAARHRLQEALGAIVGRELVSPWRPHVTLAYSLHPDGARRFEQLAAPAISALADDVAATDAVVRFEHAAVAAFDDMATFWLISARAIPPSTA